MHCPSSDDEEQQPTELNLLRHSDPDTITSVVSRLKDDERQPDPRSHLVVDFNALTSDAVRHNRFASLTSLDVSHNRIEEFASPLPATLQLLIAHHNALTNLKGLEVCVRLCFIDVSYNRLTSFRGLPHFSSRDLILVASSNLISHLERLVKCAGCCLRELELSDNKIERLNEVMRLCDECPRLAHLDIRDNDVVSAKPQCISMAIVKRPDLCIRPTPEEAQRCRRQAEIIEEQRCSSVPHRLHHGSEIEGVKCSTVHASLGSLRDALHQLELERATSAMLRRQLRMEQRRRQELAHCLKRREETAALLLQGHQGAAWRTTTTPPSVELEQRYVSDLVAENKRLAKRVTELLAERVERLQGAAVGATLPVQ